MTKTEFIAAVLPAYIKRLQSSVCSDDHALWATNLVKKLEECGITFSEESINNKKRNTIVQDVEEE